MNHRVTKTVAAFAATVLTLTLLSACGTPGTNIPEPTNVPKETTRTYVFFSTGRSLIQEPKIVDAGNVYAATLNEWLKAEPKVNEDVAIVQPNAKVLGVTVKDGLATVNWSADVLKFDATDQEKFLAWAGVRETLGQFPEIKDVQFTVEGKTSGQVGGKDVEAFWGRVSLKGQPWPALRPPNMPGASSASTETTKPAGKKK